MMATYTVTLSKNYSGLATYKTSSISYNNSTMMWSPSSVTKPTWNSGRSTFVGYYIGTTQAVASSGFINLSSISSNKSATEKWNILAPAAMISSQSAYIAEIVYDGGVWYSDYANRVPFDASHPIAIPARELYRFVGCYSTNATTGTKYINADGTPTAAFLALSPSADITIYAQWELASVKITISSTYGDFAYKTFYQSKTADANGKYGYYTNSACPESSRIYGIPVPTRELYQWGGLRASSSSSGTLWANADGTFTDTFKNRSAAAVTAYGNFWTQVSYKITISPQSGSAQVLAYYTHKTNGGIYADWLCATTALDYLPIPVRVGYRFLGYYSASSGGTKFVEYTGEIQSALKTQKATDTIYAQWRQATRTITLNGNGGTPSSATIYYDGTGAAFFNEASATITSVTPPTYTGNTFAGYFTAASGGTQVIGTNGVISQSYVPSGNDTLYAQWTIGKSIVDIDHGEGFGGTERFYCNIAAHKFYADEEMTQEITSVTLPTLRLFNTNGVYSQSVGGTQIINASGVISASFTPSNEFVTIYAQYSRRCYEIKLDSVGGLPDTSSIYHAPGGSTFYADDALTTSVSRIDTPARQGYAFGGFYYDGAQIIRNTGVIISSAAKEADYTATASWTANTYTLTFNAAGGTASFASKTVTYGAAIGQLPTATYSGHRFEEWQIDGVAIDSSTVWSFAQAKTAIAKYETAFGDVEDYFKLGNANLIPESSDGGESKPHNVAYNATSEAPATETGCVWRNPRVTYRVVGDMTLNVTLGAAFAAVQSGGLLNPPTKTGYMITSVEIDTSIGESPRVTVSATANEGYTRRMMYYDIGATPAIKTYALQIPITRRHRPQNLMNSVSGGGQLQRLTLRVSCDAVVVAEDGMPCASDICHGRIEVAASTGAYNNETEPTAANGFTSTGAVLQRSGVGYKTWAINARKELS